MIPEDDDASYLRLAQFLDLQSQWRDSHSLPELCHRICRTAALLLEGPCVAIGLAPRGEPYAIIARDGPWPQADMLASAGSPLVSAAQASGTPQLRSVGDHSHGVFPFRAPEGLSGCLHVRVPRPLLRGVEVSFLRFLASVAGSVLQRHPCPPAPSEQSQREEDPKPLETAARRYVAMAVHDLRNPLNVVSGYAALLDDESLGTLAPGQREAVEAIGRQVKKLLSVVDLLIDLNQMTGAGSALHPSRFEMRDLFEDLGKTCFPHANGQLRWPGAEAAFEFTCDRRRLFSIVQNLVDNALKHAGDGIITVDCKRADGQLVIDVRDQGPGLDADLRTSLVAHAQTGSENAPRSGLGLFTIASHVHALGGAVEVDSRDVAGTTIRVRIPPSRHAPSPHASPTLGADNGSIQALAEAP